MSSEGSKFLVEYCGCGGAFKVTAHTEQDSELAERLLTQWQSAHVGAGHWSTTAHTSNMARNFWVTRPSVAQKGPS